MKKLESFKKHVLKWIAADYHSCYCSLMLKLPPTLSNWPQKVQIHLEEQIHYHLKEKRNL